MKSTYVYRYQVLCRVLTAAIGGYFLSVLTAIILSYILPTETVHAIAWSSMLFFIIYVAVILWVFSAASWKKAVFGVFGCTLILASVVALITSPGVWS